MSSSDLAKFAMTQSTVQSLRQLSFFCFETQRTAQLRFTAKQMQKFS